MKSEYNKPFKDVLSKTFFGLSDYSLTLLIYTFAIGLLSLATPITAQSLVNTFALSTDIEPLINLSFMLLGLLLVFGVIKSFQYLTVELMQQKLITQLSVIVAKKVVLGPRSEFQKHNIREKSNRFFEIISIQKILATLVTDGLSILIQTVIGLILLSLYHPFFIPFNLFFATTIYLVFRYFNSKAKVTAIDESSAKFAVAGFIQDVANSESRLQNEQISLKLLRQSDKLILNYIKYRKEHFKILFSQNIIYLFIYAFINASLLGLGGFLIAKGQLSVGQLVAAEIIVNGLSVQLIYAMKHLQQLYDLYGSADKLNWILDLKEVTSSERYEKDHLISPSLNQSTEFDIDKLSLGFKNKKQLSLKILSGEHYVFQFVDSKVKEQLTSFLLKNSEPSSGKIKINGVSYQDLCNLEVRDLVHYIDEPLIFDGTIRDNLLDFDSSIELSTIYNVLDKFGLTALVNSFPDKIYQKIHPATNLLSYSQKYRLNLARIFLHNPKLLLIQTGNDLYSRKMFQTYLQVFRDGNCAILNFQHDETLKETFNIERL